MIIIMEQETLLKIESFERDLLVMYFSLEVASGSMQRLTVQTLHSKPYIIINVLYPTGVSGPYNHVQAVLHRQHHALLRTCEPTDWGELPPSLSHEGWPPSAIAVPPSSAEDSPRRDPTSATLPGRRESLAFDRSFSIRGVRETD